MSQIADEQRNRIVMALRERGATLPCPRCSNGSFSLLDGYVSQSLQQSIDGVVIGGMTVPTVAVACDRCGYIMLHAVGALGLLGSKK